MPSPTSLRSVTTAGSLSLAALFAVAGVTQAATVPSFRYDQRIHVLRTTVTGTDRTGVWRLRFVSPTGNRRLEIVLRSGDTAFSGSVRVSHRQGNSWSLVSRQDLDEALTGGPAVGGCAAGICWNSADLRLPANGNSQFSAKVTMTHKGTYQVSGGVRQASEAFIFGRWLSSGMTPVINW